VIDIVVWFNVTKLNNFFQLSTALTKNWQLAKTMQIFQQIVLTLLHQRL